MMRTHYCGQLRKSDIGDRVKVCGWVQARRDMGGVEEAYAEMMKRIGLA